MFGKQENDGFLDGLARTAAQTAIIFAVFAILWYLVCSFFEALRTKPLTVLIWIGVLMSFIYFANQIEKKDKRNKALQPKPVEDTRSGQEIWNENMKDYDAERGY